MNVKSFGIYSGEKGFPQYGNVDKVFGGILNLEGREGKK
jgi:hypothetical protein